MQNIISHLSINDQRNALGWISYSDIYGNVLLTIFPDADRDEVKLHFTNEVRDIVPIADALHDTYAATERVAQYIAGAIWAEFEARGY